MDLDMEGERGGGTLVQKLLNKKTNKEKNGKKKKRLVGWEETSQMGNRKKAELR